MKISRILTVFLLASAAWCADYQVVFKSSGKILHGEFVSEDATTLTVKIDHAEVIFKKEKLDLDRMLDLNKAVANAAAPSATPLTSEDKHQALVADEIKHWENNLGAAQKLLADCRAGKVKCTNGDYKVANAQVEDSQRTLRELKLEHGTYEDREEQELVNRHTQLIGQMNAARKAFTKAEDDKASPAVIEARRDELLRLQKEFDQVERAMVQRRR